MKAEVIREKVAQALCASRSGKWDNIAEMARDSWRLDATVLRSLLTASNLVVVDLAELEAALKPFADEAKQPKYSGYSSNQPIAGFHPGLAIADLRRAAALLAAITQEGRG